MKHNWFFYTKNSICYEMSWFMISLWGIYSNLNMGKVKLVKFQL